METALLTSNVFLWLVLIWNVLLTLSLIMQRKSDNAPMGLKAGQAAPGFRAQTLDGEAVSLATYAGRKVAFLFTITWCSHCRKTAPAWDPLVSAASQAGVELILVNYGTTKATRAFVDKLCPHLTALAAPRANSSFFKDYKVNGTPAYCLVNEEGIVQMAGRHEKDGGEWEKLVESWLQLSTTQSLAAEGHELSRV